eukprot:scaffold14427_cov21-Tisochrysis_lutea.AAC.2
MHLYSAYSSRMWCAVPPQQARRRWHPSSHAVMLMFTSAYYPHAPVFPTQVVVFHGSKRAADAADLEDADVVLTTYSVLENEHRKCV